MSRLPRLLLLIPDVAAEGGGIAAVSRSLMRLLGRKVREGDLSLHVVSLQSPVSPSNAKEIQDWIGSSYSHHGGSVPHFALDVMARVLRQTDSVFSTHLGLSRLLPLVPAPLRPTWGTLLVGLECWASLPLSRRKGVQLSDFLISISAYTQSRCRAANPWLGEGEVCWLGISPAPQSVPLDVFERSLRFRPATTDILIVGRMAKGEGGKGHEQLFEAMRTIKLAVPQARLIVVGGGNDIDRYRLIASQSPVASSILFTGPVSASLMATMYQHCGVFAMPSRQEGFGLVYVEAMREGMPCLVSTEDAGQEIVPDGVCGFAVDQADTKAMAVRLIDLLTNLELRGRMGEAGRARFERYFTESAFHARFWSLLEKRLS